MVNLSVVLLEFVLRGGTPNAQLMMSKYRQQSGHPGVYGLSSVFHPGYSLDQLARSAWQPHPRIHYATVSELVVALAPLGCEPVLIHTPNPRNPDHATLGVARLGVTLPSLPLDAAQALADAFHVAPNPYQRPRP
jgi:hypothetical protein